VLGELDCIRHNQIPKESQSHLDDRTENMKQKRQSTAIAGMIKVNILAALVAKGDVARAVAEAIRQALGTTTNPSGNTGAGLTTTIANAAHGAIRGAIQTGCDL